MEGGGSKRDGGRECFLSPEASSEVYQWQDPSLCPRPDCRSELLRIGEGQLGSRGEFKDRAPGPFETHPHLA